MNIILELVDMIPEPDLWGAGGTLRRNQPNNWDLQEENLQDNKDEENTRRKHIQQLEEEHKRHSLARRWYLIVIVLLYVGLLASFSLNVSLLIRKPYIKIPSELSGNPADSSSPHSVVNIPTPTPGRGNHMGFAYRTPCLVAVPCESGWFYDCGTGVCEECPRGSYQPQWGQTSCWPCPANTTTDALGSREHYSCKRHDCPFYAKEGVGILESPNYPGNYPLGVECRWRVRPGHTRRVLIIVSHLSLAPDCTDTFTIRRSDHPKTGIVFKTCSSRNQPLVITGHSKNLWVHFSTNGQTSASGFQMTVLSVEEELGYLVDAIVNEGEITSFDTQAGSGGGSLNQEDKLLLSRLLLLLNPGYTSNIDTNLPKNTARRKKPVIEVLEEYRK